MRSIVASGISNPNCAEKRYTLNNRSGSFVTTSSLGKRNVRASRSEKPSHGLIKITSGFVKSDERSTAIVLIVKSRRHRSASNVSARNPAKSKVSRVSLITIRAVGGCSSNFTNASPILSAKALAKTIALPASAKSRSVTGRLSSRSRTEPPTR